MTQNATLPDRAAQSWRLWLLTGSRREQVDRRRLRGAHLGLKRVLLEDMLVRGEPAYGWKEFSDAMLRHAIGDAVRMLPERDGQVLKLAYFGGFSNHEIASQIGITEAAVAARLRRALDEISARIQQGGATLRRAAYAVAAWFGGRWCEDWVHRAAEASAVAAVAVVVATGAAAPVSGSAAPGHDRVAATAAAAPVAVTGLRTKPVLDSAAVPSSAAPQASGGSSATGSAPQRAPLPAVNVPVPALPAPPARPAVSLASLDGVVHSASVPPLSPAPAVKVP